MAVKTSDWAIVFATLIGPVLAVQAQKWVERWRDRLRRKQWVFQTLMSTRAARLTPEHVRALNMIDLVFYGTRLFGTNHRSQTEQKVIDKWKEYLDDLTDPWDPNANNDAKVTRRANLFTDLLESIATDMGYSFDRVHLNKGAYHPAAHVNESAEQEQLRRAAIRVFSGESPLKMDVERFPSDAEAIQALKELYRRMNAALDGERALSVKVEAQSDHRY
jgi:hypothetical protein